MKPKLLISAGGESSRIKPFINSKKIVSKHLLKVPGTETSLVEKIVEDANEYFDEILVYANKENINAFERGLKNCSNCKCIVNSGIRGPLEPMVKNVLNRKNPYVFGCAGDLYANFKWDEFSFQHRRTKADISILLSQSDPTINGATFALFNDEENRIHSWIRKSISTSADLINIGAYVISSTNLVAETLMKLTKFKEDEFFDVALSSLKVNAVIHYGKAFNINTKENYLDLEAHLGKQ